jgi:hypothetical protein
VKDRNAHQRQAEQKELNRDTKEGHTGHFARSVAACQGNEAWDGGFFVDCNTMAGYGRPWTVKSGAIEATADPTRVRAEEFEGY